MEFWKLIILFNKLFNFNYKKNPISYIRQEKGNFIDNNQFTIKNEKQQIKNYYIGKVRKKKLK